MEITEYRDKNFYGNLSKKELQDWCKKYGLAPSGRGSELVNSLNFYFEKRNSNPASLSEGCSVHSTSLLPPAQLCACLRDIADGQKDNFVANRGKINELLQCKVFESSKKESNKQILDIRRSARLNKNTEIRRTKNVLQIEQQPTQNAPVPTKRKSDSGRYFEVNCTSERGINLFVDLNSTSIDYYRQMGKQVLVDINKQKEKKFGSFREEVLSLGSNHNQAKKSLHQTTIEDNLLNQIASYTEPCHMGIKSKLNGQEPTPIILVDQDSNCDCSDESCGGCTAKVTEEKESQNPASGTEVSDLCVQDNLATPVRPKRKTADLEIANDSTNGNQNQKIILLRSGKLVEKSGLRRSVHLFAKESKNLASGTEVSDLCVQDNLATPVRSKQKTADLEIASKNTNGNQHKKIIHLRSGKLIGESDLRRSGRLFGKESKNPAGGTTVSDSLCVQDNLATQVRSKPKTADPEIANNSINGNYKKIILLRSGKLIGESGLRGSVGLFHKESTNPASGTEVSDSPCVQDSLATPVRRKRKTADLEIANNSTNGNQDEKIILLRSGKLIGESGLRSVHLFNKESKNPASGTEVSGPCVQDSLATPVRPKRKMADLEIANNSTNGNQDEKKILLRSGNLIGESGLRRSVHLFPKESKNPVSGTEVSDIPFVQDNLATPVRPKRKTADLEIANSSTSGNQQEKRTLLRSGKLIGKSDLRRSACLALTV